MLRTKKDRERDHTFVEEDEPEKSPEFIKQPPNRSVACRECGALYNHEKWSWEKLPPYIVNNIICPACKRVMENNPAGIIEISGPYFFENRTLVLNLARNICAKAILDSPLNRCIKINDKAEKVLISTTSEELIRNIGDTLFNAYNGNLNYWRENDCLWISWKK